MRTGDYIIPSPGVKRSIRIKVGPYETPFRSTKKQTLLVNGVKSWMQAIIQRADQYVRRKLGSHIWEKGGPPGVGSGKVCRMYGARKPNMVRRDANHPQYRHSGETLEAKAERHEMAVFFNATANLMVALSIVAPGSTRTRGRKPVI